MNIERKKEIQDKAKEINALSEQFQLVHATYASSEYIRTVVREFYQKELDKLKIRILDKTKKDQDTTQELLEKSELENLLRFIWLNL